MLWGATFRVGVRQPAHPAATADVPSRLPPVSRWHVAIRGTGDIGGGVRPSGDLVLPFSKASARNEPCNPHFESFALYARFATRRVRGLWVAACFSYGRAER